MAKQNILVGASANDKTGDTLRNAFVKANANFTELYTLTGGSAADLRELAQDYAAPLFNHASHTNITVTYDDANNKILLTGAAAQVQSNWTAVSGLGVILNKPTLFDGAYASLTGAPTIPAAAVWPVTNTAGASGPSYIAIGNSAGHGTQTVAIGYGAGSNGGGVVGTGGVAIGSNANAGGGGVGIGFSAGTNVQGQNAVALGNAAGQWNQGAYSIAIGNLAGHSDQGTETVAIGALAGEFNQGTETVAIGALAGEFNQGQGAVAVGFGAGYNLQGVNSVAIGKQAGLGEQGANAIAIGYRAGDNWQAANTIILNASGAIVNGVAEQTNSFYVSPIRTATATSNVLYYNTTTKEITYAAAGSVSSLVNGAKTVSLSSSGNLTLPSGLTFRKNGTPYSTITADLDKVLQIETQTSGGVKQWSLGTDGTTTFPDGYLKIVSNGANPYISNRTDNGLGLVSGNFIQIRQSTADAYGITIDSSTTDTSLGGGASLASGSNIDVNGTKIILGRYDVNYADANTGLTSQNKIEINNNTILIGQKVSTITSGVTSSTFSGWTFGTNTGTLTFPDATVQTTAYTGTSTTRSAGSVAGAGTVTLNYSTDRLVRATAAGSTITIAHSNIAAGKVVDLVISNTSGASCTVTYGVAAGNTIGGTTTFAIGNGTSHVFTCRSFGTTTTDVYVTVV